MGTYTDLLSELREQAEGVNSQATLIVDATSRVIATAAARAAADTEGLDDALSDATSAMESIRETLIDLLGELTDCVDELSTN